MICVCEEQDKLGKIGEEKALLRQGHSVVGVASFRVLPGSSDTPLHTQTHADTHRLKHMHIRTLITQTHTH